MLHIETAKELLGGLLLRSCLMGAFAFLGAGVLCCLWRFCRKRLGGLWLRSRSQFVALAIAAGIATGVAQKSTNNVPPNLNQPQVQQGGGSSQTGLTGLSGSTGLHGMLPNDHLSQNLVNPVNPVQNNIPGQTTNADIARGWHVESVTTNSEPFAAMPSNAVEYARWSLRGGRETWFPLELGGFEFPLGTNRVRRLRVLSGGMVETFSPNEPAAICAAREYASLIPGYSRFRWADFDDGAAKALRWEGIFAGRDRTGEYDAEIRLFANGDFLTRSNDVETVCRRVNPDDWDGDGLANERDANPTSYDGDFFGVANALPTNANPNAYYWLDLSVTGVLGVATICVTCDGASDLGDHVIIARTNQVCHIPLLAGATYAVESDLPIDDAVVSSEYAEIATNSETSLTVRLPVQLSFETGASGDALTSNFILLSAPVDVGAALTSITGGCCLCELNGTGFTWICSEECECAGSGHALSASATWEGYTRIFDWWGTCSCDREEPSECFDEGIGLSLEMQSTYIVNDDDDDDDGLVDAMPPFSDMDDEIVTNRILFVSSTPTNGTVKLQSLNGLEQGVNGARKVYADRTALAQIEEGHEYNVSNSGGATWEHLVNPVVTSSHYLDGQVRVLWKPESGPRASASKRFTIIEPTVEPITDESWSIADLTDGRYHTYLYNPCAVAVGQTAMFKIDVMPEDYPDSEIVWTADNCDGAVRFSGTNVNTGRVVIVEGLSTGDIQLEIHFGDAVSYMPKFEFKVLEPRTVKLRAWVIGRDSAWCRSGNDVRSMVVTASDIFAQIGVSLQLVEPIVFTNIPAAYNVALDEPNVNQWSMGQLTSLTNGTDGLECYFVNDIMASIPLHGANHEGGMVLASTADGITLAHEIGHAFGLRDIYVSNDIYTNNTVSLKVLGTEEKPCAEKMPWDWNCGCIGRGVGGVRFYGKGTTMQDVIGRMLMNGVRPDNTAPCDITFGNVYGVWYNGSYKEDDDWTVGYVPVGIFMNEIVNMCPVHQ